MFGNKKVMRKIIIDKEIFARFPDFKRGIIVVSYIENAVSNEKIKEILAGAMAERAGFDFNISEYITAWDEAHKKFNSNPNRYPPSIKSLLKRAVKGGELPFINSVVALFNYVSLKYLLPCGGDDISAISGNLYLGFAKGDEHFTPLGSVESEPPEASEVIYYDDRTFNVMCRRWNWRNGDFSKIAAGSKKIVINIDGLGPATTAYAKQARDEMADLLKSECKAELAVDLLDKEKQEMEIEL